MKKQKMHKGKILLSLLLGATILGAGVAGCGNQNSNTGENALSISVDGAASNASVLKDTLWLICAVESGRARGEEAELCSREFNLSRSLQGDLKQSLRLLDENDRKTIEDWRHPYNSKSIRDVEFLLERPEGIEECRTEDYYLSAPGVEARFDFVLFYCDIETAYLAGLRSEPESTYDAELIQEQRRQRLERQRQTELERQRRIEQERQRRAELERVRKEKVRQENESTVALHISLKCDQAPVGYGRKYGEPIYTNSQVVCEREWSATRELLGAFVVCEINLGGVEPNHITRKIYLTEIDEKTVIGKRYQWRTSFRANNKFRETSCKLHACLPGSCIPARLNPVGAALQT